MKAPEPLVTVTAPNHLCAVFARTPTTLQRSLRRKKNKRRNRLEEAVKVYEDKHR